MGYSTCGREELDTTEWFHIHVLVTNASSIPNCLQFFIFPMYTPFKTEIIVVNFKRNRTLSIIFLINFLICNKILEILKYFWTAYFALKASQISVRSIYNTLLLTSLCKNNSDEFNYRQCTIFQNDL